MQCPSCQFENMPGSERCARCATSLRLAAAEIDVHPPRASALQRRFAGRPLASLRRLIGSVGETISSMAGVRTSTTHFHGTLTEYLSLVVPGLFQLRRGERNRGMLWLAGFLILGLLSLVLAGTGSGSIVLGILFAWHVIATVDAISRRFESPGDRMRLSLACAAGIGVLLYLPALSAIRRVAVPVGISMTTPYFGTGDVVWYHPSTACDVGDLVLYEIPYTQTAAQGPGRYPVQYRVGGSRINRMVAKPGQTVRYTRDGTLWVDGVRSPWQPRVKLSLPVEQDIPVRPHCVFILPETLLPGMGLQIGPEVAVSLSMVPAANIEGPVLARTFPPHRFRLY